VVLSYTWVRRYKTVSDAAMGFEVKGTIRRFFELLATALLLGTQTILYAGAAIGIMTIPLLPYLYTLAQGDFSTIIPQIWAMFFLNTFTVGRIIMLIGVVVLFVAAGQWLWSHHKKRSLFKTGIYAKVRHPQFTGIIIITMGLTVMVLTRGFVTSIGSVELWRLVGLWFLQVLGYIAIARYEEWRLTKKYSGEYKEYKQTVPFLFPIKTPKKIPETLFTILIVIVICIILLSLPYQLIASYSRQYFPTIWSP
jgi:protein-S-isoprenylcysteine O-methyltransferase Ste14